MVLTWIGWTAIAFGVAGVLACAGYLAFATSTGREAQLGLPVLGSLLTIGTGTIMAVFV